MAESKDYVPDNICKLEIELDKAENQELGRLLVENELKLLSRLDHPNLMSVSESFEDRNNIYFIIDNLEGGCLYDRIIYNGCI